MQYEIRMRNRVTTSDRARWFLTGLIAMIGVLAAGFALTAAIDGPHRYIDLDNGLARVAR